MTAENVIARLRAAGYAAEELPPERPGGKRSNIVTLPGFTFLDVHIFPPTHAIVAFMGTDAIGAYFSTTADLHTVEAVLDALGRATARWPEPPKFDNLQRQGGCAHPGCTTPPAGPDALFCAEHGQQFEKGDN
jgi:hypothetical protein